MRACVRACAWVLAHVAYVRACARERTYYIICIASFVFETIVPTKCNVQPHCTLSGSSIYHRLESVRASHGVSRRPPRSGTAPAPEA